MPKTKKEEIRELKKEISHEKEKTAFAKDLAKKAIKGFNTETRKQTVTALLAAFGFLIALVWRDVITKYTNNIVTFFAFPGPSTLGILYTAILTTIIAVLGIIFINSWNSKKDGKLEKKLDEIADALTKST